MRETDRPSSTLVWTLVVGLGILLALVYIGLWVSYPLFHMLAELFAIAVAVATFMVTWNARRYMESGYLLFIGIAYFFVAGIDLLHAISYRGMVLIPGADTDLPTQLWIAARYLQASALVIAPAYITRRLDPRKIVAGYVIASAALVIAIFAGAFPVAFDEGTGLTPFKIYSEFAIAALMLVGLVLLLRRRAELDRSVVELMSASIGASIIAELMFTQYAIDPYGLANMIGHLLRILSYYLVYVAIVKNSLQRPYDVLFRELSKTAAALRDSEVRFRSTFEQATLGIAHISLDGRYLAVNQRLAEITGYGVEELEGTRPSGITHPDDRDTEKRLLAKMDAHEIDEYRLENRLVRRDGTIVWVNTARALVRDAADEPRYQVSIVEDISARRNAERQQKRARQLSDALNAIDRTVLASFDTDMILQRVIEDAAAVLSATAAAALDRDGPDLIVHRVHRLEPSMLGTVVPTDPDGPSSQALSLGVPVFVASPQDAPGATRELMRHYDFEAMLVTPLLFRGDDIGSLAFLFADPVPDIGDLEMDFARKLSGVISIAMENARLYSAERDIADALQTSLIGAPQSLDGLELAHAYYSATELTKIGGDFYDVFPVAGDNVAFALGDVSGKGLEAAAVTAMAKNTIRAFAYRDPDPSAVFDSANKVIAEQIGDGRFITAVFGTIHLPSGLVRMACAGHPAPIRCGSPGCAEEPVIRNLPLGVFENSTFEYYETTLTRGEVLVLFSDGLIDARRGTDLLGEERVREILAEMGFEASPQKVVDELLEAAQAHTDGNPPDDIAILALRYTGRA